MDDKKDMQLRPMSAPASGQRSAPTPDDSSCSISIQVQQLEQQNRKLPRGRDEANDNNSQASSQGSFIEGLEEAGRVGGQIKGNCDSPASQATATGRKQRQMSDGQTEDSSEATRELFKLVTELSDCRDSMNESRNGDCCRRLTGMSQETGLLYCNRECLKLKDFSSEVRASMDVEQFVHQAELMLDMREISVEDIVEAMLERVSEGMELDDYLSYGSVG